MGRGKGERAQNLELFPTRYRASVFKYGEQKKKNFETRRRVKISVHT
jgi:hypothetical protein